MSDTELSAPPACSQCAGPHLYGLDHRHRTTCPRYAAELSTVEADHRRGRGIRPATLTEQEILDEHRYEQPDLDEEYAVEYRHEGGIHSRRPLIVSGSGRHRPAERLIDSGRD